MILVLTVCCWLLTVRAEYGSLCQCHCGIHKVDPTILLSAEDSCSQCSVDLCRSVFFKECRHVDDILTACINRTAIQFQVSILAFHVLFVMCIAISTAIHCTKWSAQVIEKLHIPLSVPQDDDAKTVVELKSLVHEYKVYDEPLNSPVTIGASVKEWEQSSKTSRAARRGSVRFDASQAGSKSHRWAAVTSRDSWASGTPAASIEASGPPLKTLRRADKSMTTTFNFSETNSSSLTSSDLNLAGTLDMFTSTPTSSLTGGEAYRYTDMVQRYVSMRSLKNTTVIVDSSNEDDEVSSEDELSQTTTEAVSSTTDLQPSEATRTPPTMSPKLEDSSRGSMGVFGSTLRLSKDLETTLPETEQFSLPPSVQSSSVAEEGHSYTTVEIRPTRIGRRGSMLSGFYSGSKPQVQQQCIPQPSEDSSSRGLSRFASKVTSQTPAASVSVRPINTMQQSSTLGSKRLSRFISRRRGGGSEWGESEAESTYSRSRPFSRVKNSSVWRGTPSYGSKTYDTSLSLSSHTPSKDSSKTAGNGGRGRREASLVKTPLEPLLSNERSSNADDSNSEDSQEMRLLRRLSVRFGTTRRRG